MKNLDDFDFRGKVVLVRADLNSDVRVSRVAGRRSPVAKVLEGERIRASAETIRELKRKGARVVVLAHQGRKPEGFSGVGHSGCGGIGRDDFISLRQHARLLNKYVKVRFVEDVCGALALGEIGKMKNGEVILLENVRFVADEFAPEKGKRNSLYKLVEVADVFVNDAFSVCHRRQASVVLFPKYLPSFAGRLLFSEVEALQKIVVSGSRGLGVSDNCGVLYVLGGAKPADNLKLIGRGKVLACGLFGQMCLIASGKKLGAQEDYLKRVVGDYDLVLKELRRIIKPRITQMDADLGELKLRRGGEIFVPLDFAVKIKGKRKEIGVEDFPCEYEIFDIGSRTIEKFVDEIGKSKVVFMKGPAGDAGDERFAKGSVALMKAVSKVGFSLVGGGHLSDVIRKYRLRGFNHVSLAGGATVRFLANEELPGLSALVF